MKVSHSKTEYMCVNEREGSGTVRLQGEEVKKVQEFKYLGSTVQSNGECGKVVKKRVQAGWNGWRKVWGVLCDRKISARIKGKVYRTVVRAAMLYGLETVSLRKRQESELEVAELKMLRGSLGVTRLDRIRTEYIRGTAHVGRLGDKVREARLRWFGHVQRRETEQKSRVTSTAEQKSRATSTAEQKSRATSTAGQKSRVRPPPGRRAERRPQPSWDRKKPRREGGRETSSHQSPKPGCSPTGAGKGPWEKKNIPKKQEKSKEPSKEADTPCPLVPGDQIYLRVFQRKWNEPRREGPYKVVAATKTAVQVEAKTTWYQLNHCTRVTK
ncbi:hypothetical protein QTP86_011809, partial [Hemibagrus guttatus]